MSKASTIEENFTKLEEIIEKMKNAQTTVSISENTTFLALCRVICR